MNTFFHKAYDRYLLAITPDLSIIISDELFKSATETTFFKYLKELNGKKILLPNKFLPQKELLEIHYNQYKLKKYDRIF